MHRENKRIKVVDRATLKLTAIYTTIIMVMSIGFSVVLGYVVINAARQNGPKMPEIFHRMQFDDEFNAAYDEYMDSVESKVTSSLLLFNIGILLVGAGVSYMLARQTLKPIERAMDDETRFVSDASHELRTPLATMRMENEVLLRDKEATKADYKAEIKSNLEEIDKLRKLTDSLLKLSSNKQLEMADFQVGDAVFAAVDRISRSAEAKDIELVNNLKDFTVNSNIDALSEVIYIYLDNAVKYSPKGGKIEIFNSDKHSISVRDHGSGIDPKDLPNIFNRFYRADKSRNSEGFGLGLSLASRIAEQLGGKATAANNAGDNASGATFTIKLK